ncbi:hypothetical protein [Rhodoferax sp. WC2427]|uniref:hypothetical protein n=1 Tax=Rhodoferax sp. WC2427 TaxID=3234144 RepID=UPI003465734E
MHRIRAAAGTPVVPGRHRGANLQYLLFIWELLALVLSARKAHFMQGISAVFDSAPRRLLQDK